MFLKSEFHINDYYEAVRAFTNDASSLNRLREIHKYYQGYQHLSIEYNGPDSNSVNVYFISKRQILAFFYDGSIAKYPIRHFKCLKLDLNTLSIEIDSGVKFNFTVIAPTKDILSQLDPRGFIYDDIRRYHKDNRNEIESIGMEIISSLLR